MMVSGPRTPVRAPIGGGMLLFPGASRGAYEPCGIQLAPTPDHGLSWSTLRGRAMLDAGAPCYWDAPTWGLGYDVPRFARGSGGMADAHGSGPCVRKDVRVQLPCSPPARPVVIAVGTAPLDLSGADFFRCVVPPSSASGRARSITTDVDNSVDNQTEAVYNLRLNAGPATR